MYVVLSFFIEFSILEFIGFDATLKWKEIDIYLNKYIRCIEQKIFLRN